MNLLARESYSAIARRLVYFLTLASAVAPLFSIATSHALLAASFLGLLVLRERLRFPPIKLPLLLFFSGTIVSLLLSGHIAAGWPQVRKFYVFFLVLVTIATAFRRLGDALTLIVCWTGAAACSAGWGLVQFFRRYLQAKQAGAGLYEDLVGHRVTGFMSLWMTFEGQLMIVLLLLAALFLFWPERRKQGWPLAICAVLIALGMILALTRGPWIGGAAGAVYLVWQWKRKAVLALPVLAVLGFFAAPTTVRERVASIARPQSGLDSNQHRILLWRTGLAIIRAHPVFGLGPEQVKRQFDSYIPADFPRPLPPGWREHLHNIYLQYAAERGIPVLLAFLWMVGKVLWDLRAAASGSPGRRAVLHGCSAAIIAVLVAGFFEHNLGDSEMLQMFLTVVAIGYVALADGGDQRAAGGGV